MIIGESKVNEIKITALTHYKDYFDKLVTSNPNLPIDNLRANIINVIQVDTSSDFYLIETKQKIISQLAAYKRLWWVARDRRRNTDFLLDKINESKNYDDLLKSLSSARETALRSDFTVDTQSCFFKRNRKGSRYQTVLNNILEYTLNAAGDNFDYSAELSDLNNILKYYRKRIRRELGKNPSRSPYSRLYELIKWPILINSADDYKSAQDMLEQLQTFSASEINTWHYSIKSFYHLTVKKLIQLIETTRQSKLGLAIKRESFVKNAVAKGRRAALSAADYKEPELQNERLKIEIRDALDQSTDPRLVFKKIKIKQDEVEIHCIDTTRQEEKPVPLRVPLR